jgi:hypothetical protein
MKNKTDTIQMAHKQRLLKILVVHSPAVKPRILKKKVHKNKSSGRTPIEQWAI